MAKIGFEQWATHGVEFLETIFFLLLQKKRGTLKSASLFCCDSFRPDPDAPESTRYR